MIVASEVLLALYVFTDFFQQVSNYIVLYSIAFWVASFAAILLPYRRPEIYNSAPDFVRRKIGGVPVLVLFGVGNLILFSLVLYSAFKLPAFSGPTGTDAVLFVVGDLRAGRRGLLRRSCREPAPGDRPRSRLQRDPARLTVKIFYASDVHGSTRCFKKFLNAGKFYSADALVLGGDITGKAIVPFVEAASVRGAGGVPRQAARAQNGGGDRRARGGGWPTRATTRTAATPTRPRRSAATARRLSELFAEKIVGRVEEWMALADERLNGDAAVPCYVNAGNDDPPEIDAVIESAARVEFLEGRVVELPDGHRARELRLRQHDARGTARATSGGRAREPGSRRWRRQVRDPEVAIFNFHCPPYDTQIDQGPVLGEDMRMRSTAGGVEMQCGREHRLPRDHRALPAAVGLPRPSA